MFPVSVQHTAQGERLRWINRVVMILEHYATSLKFNVSRVKRRFSRSEYKIELNEEQEARQVQVDNLQAIAHKIELNEETEVRRVQVGTLQVIAQKIELDKEKEAGRDKVGAFQAIAYKIKLNEDKEARREQVGTLQAITHQDQAERRQGSLTRTGRHASGDRAPRSS